VKQFGERFVVGVRKRASGVMEKGREGREEMR